MARSLQRSATNLPISIILQALTPNCTGLKLAQTFSIETASTKLSRVLDNFADRLPDGLHPDDLHFLLKHIEIISSPSPCENAASNSAYHLGTGFPFTVDSDQASSATGTTQAGLADVEHTQSGSCNNTEGQRRHQILSGLGRNHDGPSNTLTCSAHTSGSARKSAGRSHSTAAKDAGRGRYRPSNNGSSGSHRHGCRGKPYDDEDLYDEEYSHLHNIIFERLEQQRSQCNGDDNSVVHVELHASSGSREGCGSGYGKSSKAIGRGASARIYYQTSGTGADVGSSRHRKSQSWERACASFDENEEGHGGCGSRPHGRQRGAHREAWEGEKKSCAAGEWASDGRPTPNECRIHRQSQRSDSPQKETQRQQHRYQQKQQKQQRQQEESWRLRDTSASRLQQQREQEGEQRQPQGRRGVDWFTKRWPKHYVDYQEYADCMKQDLNEVERNGQWRGRSRSKYYQSAFEDDRDWFSQFWTSHTTASSSSQSQQSSSQSQSYSQSYSQSAEQFTASWWQRFQATAASGGGSSSWTSRVTTDGASSTGHGSYQQQQQQAFGGNHRVHSVHTPELRAHASVLGLDMGAALDAAAVKAAFRARAKETHPDLQHGADAARQAAAEERFKTVQQAYYALSRALEPVG